MQGMQAIKFKVQDSWLTCVGGSAWHYSHGNLILRRWYEGVLGVGWEDGHEPRNEANMAGTHTVIFWKRVVFSLHIKKAASVITCDSYHAWAIIDQNHITLNKKKKQN